MGTADIAADYPLYYDAVNEKGVGMAGLNFVGNAYFPEVTEGKENVDAVLMEEYRDILI